jgi:hypothetical protein
MRVSTMMAVVFLICAASPAQLVSPAGTMDVMVTLQHTHIDAHSNPFGVHHNIDLRAIATIVSVDYSVTDRLGLGVSLPYIQSRYRGREPHPTSVSDDGSVHGSWQDLQLDARYALLRGDFVVSPFARFRYPVRDYEISGHASPGRGLRELEMGLSAGHQFLFLPDLLIAADLSYTVSEASLDNIRVNRSSAEVQVGYAVTSRLFVRGFGAWQKSYGGLDLPLSPTSKYFHYHDQLSRSSQTNAGAGVVVSVTGSVNLHLGYTTVLKAMNGHLGRSVSIGTSWTIAPRLRKSRKFPIQSEGL